MGNLSAFAVYFYGSTGAVAVGFFVTLDHNLNNQKCQFVNTIAGMMLCASMVSICAQLSEQSYDKNTGQGNPSTRLFYSSMAL